MSPAIMAMEAMMDAAVVVVAFMKPSAKFFAKSEFEVNLRGEKSFIQKFCLGGFRTEILKSFYVYSVKPD